MLLTAREHAADDAEERQARHAGGVGERLERPRLVDERLADVEEDGLHSHDATSSRSALVVTLSSFGSPSTTFTRPPRASTSAEQSVAPARSPA